MVKFFRRAFSGSDLWVSSSDQVSDFYSSAWQPGDSPVPMLVVRLMLAILSFAILLWSIVEARSTYWLVFLTNWGFLLVTLLMINGTLVCIMAISRRHRYDTEALPWYVSTYWLLFNCSIPVAFLISALYWILLYSPELKNEGKRYFMLEVSTHGFNSAIALIELLSSRTPVKYGHIYQPLSFGVWYTVFSVIYYLCGGTDSEGNPFIYEILDWREMSRSLIIVAISLAGLIIIYTAVWGIAIGRDRLSSHIFRTSSHDLPYVPPEPEIPRYIV